MEKEILDWFYSCEHRIVLSHTNSGEYIGIAISKDTQDSFSVSGKDKIKVLYSLRNMLAGTYHNEKLPVM